MGKDTDDRPHGRDKTSEDGRRGRGEGAVYQRADGGWCGQVDLGVKEDGKRDRRSVYGKTKSIVTKKMRDIMAEVTQNGVAIEPSKMTVGEYLERWLREAAAPTVRPVTVESYGYTIKAQILPDLDKVKLSQLKPLHIQRMYSNRLAAGMSRRTVQYAHAVLNRALKQAVRWQLIARNPAEAVKSPKPARHQAEVMGDDRLRALMAALAGDRMEVLFKVAIATGCRRGELVALRWSDIHWDTGTIHINRTGERVGNGVVWSEPKTSKSRRGLPVPAETLAMLRRHEVQQAEIRDNLGAHYLDEDLVFAKQTGGPINPGDVSQHFAHILKKHNLPKARLHDLRHAHATLLLEAGHNIKAVSERLGHSSIQITGDIYSHVTRTMQDQMLSTLETLLAPIKVDLAVEVRKIH
jgi:integrase